MYPTKVFGNICAFLLWLVCKHSYRGRYRWILNKWQKRLHKYSLVLCSVRKLLLDTDYNYWDLHVIVISKHLCLCIAIRGHIQNKFSRKRPCFCGTF